MPPIYGTRLSAHLQVNATNLEKARRIKNRLVRLKREVESVREVREQAGPLPVLPVEAVAPRNDYAPVYA